MLGHDVEDASLSDWQSVASIFKQKQIALIAASVERQLAHLMKCQPALPQITIVSAGVGAFLVKEVIAQFTQKAHYPPMHIHSSAQLLSRAAQASVADTIPLQQWASHCLPAVAVAILANKG